MNAILDQGRLADIGAASAGGQAGFVAEFRRSHAVDSAKLRAAAAAGDCAQVTALAHGIEGACRVLGAIHKPVTESKLSPMIAQHRHNLRSAQPD